MVIFLQLCILVVFTILRGRMLFGMHLPSVSSERGILDYTLKVRGTVIARHIGIYQHGGIPFVIRPERAYDRILKNLGIASEISIGNAAFDKKYFIITDFPGHLEQLLASKELRMDVQKLFRWPVKSLHATRSRVWCVISRKHIHKPRDHFDRHALLLGNISAASGASLTVGLPPASRWRGMAALSFIALQGGVLTLGLLGNLSTYADSAHTEDTAALILKGAMAGMLAAFAWGFCILALFKGSPWVSWVLADFVLFGLAGFLLSGMVAVREVNLHAPQPAAQIHELPVIEKICVLKCSMRIGKSTRRSSYMYNTAYECSPESRENIVARKEQSDPICASSNRFEYTLRLRHWREAQPYEFSPSVKVFDSVGIAEPMKVPVHQGALGLEWIDWDEITAR